MTDNQPAKDERNQSGVYEIRIEEHLSDLWIDRFGDLTIKLEDDGTTLLKGTIIDQAELFGLLKKVRNLGMKLLSVNCVSAFDEDEQE